MYLSFIPVGDKVKLQKIVQMAWTFVNDRCKLCVCACVCVLHAVPMRHLLDALYTYLGLWLMFLGVKATLVSLWLFLPPPILSIDKNQSLKSKDYQCKYKWCN